MLSAARYIFRKECEPKKTVRTYCLYTAGLNAYGLKNEVKAVFYATAFFIANYIIAALLYGVKVFDLCSFIP